MERHGAKERMQRCQPRMTTDGTMATFLLQMRKKRAEERRVQVLERQRRRSFVQPLLGKPEEEAAAVAVAGDRVGARLPLAHQSVGTGGFQQAREGGIRRQGVSPPHRS